MEFRNYLHSKRNSNNFNELNEASKSRMIKPRNLLSPVDEKLHRNAIIDNMKKFLDAYFDSFEILVELDKLADEVVTKKDTDKPVDKADVGKLGELRSKFQEKEKEVKNYLEIIERYKNYLKQNRFNVASETIINFRRLGLKPWMTEKADW